MKEKNNNRKKGIVYTLFTIGIILLVIGVSYAAYTFSGTGTTENVITTGQIEVSFAEQNNIKIQNRYPETDAQGLANTDSNSQMTFTVSSNIVGDATVNYAIGLTSITEGSTLTQDYIKIYLTKNGSVASGWTTGVGQTIKSFESYKVTGYLDSHAIAQGTITGTQVDTYVLKAWIDENYDLPTTDTSSGTTHSATTTSETFSFKIKAIGTDSAIQIESGSSIQQDSSNANAPELASNMIPVIYDAGNSTWVKSDSSNKDLTWFNYTDKKWANAVTVTSTNRDTYLKASAGTPIAMSDINTMWVWIPRFSATKNGEYNGATEFACSNHSYTTKETCESNNWVWYPTNPGAFNITFVDKYTTAHDAFTFGSDPLSGFWMGKFEITGSVASACTSSSCDVSNVTILPNKLSLVAQTVSSFFYMSRSMEQNGNAYGFDKTVDTTLDTHMLKNNEWGAVAYLTQSIYGRCSSSTSCTELEVNTSFDEDEWIAITGGNDYVSSVNQSTTGNIYGVYDMSGGAEDYVMGVYKPETLDEITDYSGFSSSTSNSRYDKLPDNKYYNVYTTSEDYTNAGLQHALTETNGWYGGFTYFVDGSNPWFERGGSFDIAGVEGVFVFGHDDGYDFGDHGCRPSLVK